MTVEEQLNHEGLAAHLDDQARAGIDALLIAGSMGCMPMLREATWRELVTVAVEQNRGRFELLVGVTDQGLTRVLDRLAFVEQFRGIDGVAVLTPSLVRFSQDEFIAFYRAVADAARHPVMLYDLQVGTGVSMTVETLRNLSMHPNIAGVKISCDLPKATLLREAVDRSDFRIIPADSALVEATARLGYADHLEGMFAAAPEWSVGIARAVANGRLNEAGALQRRLTALKNRMIETGALMGAFSALMNARGVPGRFAPAPLRMLDPQERARFLGLAEVRELIDTQAMTIQAEGRPVVAVPT